MRTSWHVLLCRSPGRGLIVGKPLGHPSCDDLQNSMQNRTRFDRPTDVLSRHAPIRVWSRHGCLPSLSARKKRPQRGAGVYDKSIAGLQRLNALGYGKTGSGLDLTLVYNPQGPSLPPPQDTLEADYKTYLKDHFGIDFTRLFTITNMPIKRFGSTLVSRGQFEDYMALLRSAHSDSNLGSVMCRNLLSIDWQGYTFDCDFNQMLGIPLRLNGKPRTHIRDLLDVDLQGRPIMVADHCYGCTAGQGSSCGGALN